MPAARSIPLRATEPLLPCRGSLVHSVTIVAGRAMTKNCNHPVRLARGHSVPRPAEMAALC